MKNIVAKCTRSVTYMPKLYRPTRTSSQVTHRPLGSIISLCTVLHEPLYLLLAKHANECRITAHNKRCWTADTYIVEPAITLIPSDLLATEPAAQWHVADGIATVIIAAAVQQHTCFNVASVECHSSDVDNGQWYVADDCLCSHQCQDSTAAAVLVDLLEYSSYVVDRKLGLVDALYSCHDSAIWTVNNEQHSSTCTLVAPPPLPPCWRRTLVAA